MRAFFVLVGMILMSAAIVVPADGVASSIRTPTAERATVAIATPPAPVPARLDSTGAAGLVSPASPPPLVPATTGRPPTDRGTAPPGSASAAVLLLDDASGAVLFERNGYASLAPASLTKVATAVVAIERGDLDAAVTVDVDSRTMRGSTVMGLEPGDRLTLRDLLYGLMLPSGNDAALAIGRHVAGSDPAFIDAMNALLARLGLTQSHFSNPHGLGGTGHYASAHDLAKLSRYAMTLPAYREVASADQWVARGSREIAMYSLVTDVRWRIPGADAGKSGYTRSAGRTLVVSAERDGHRLHAVVLNDPQTEAVAAAILEWGFANFDWSAAAPDGAVAEPDATLVPRGAG